MAGIYATNPQAVLAAKPRMTVSDATVIAPAVTVSQIMSKKPLTISPETTARQPGPRSTMTERPVRPSILAMARDAVLARLAAIREGHPGVLTGFAHHQSKGGEMSDDDLRSVLEDAERAIESS